MTDIWTVQEAKGKLSEVLRRARTHGPQTIGKSEPCVVVTKEMWEACSGQRPSLSEWLLANTPAGHPLPEIDRTDPPRKIPFVDDE